MNIAIDIDDTIADTAKHLSPAVAEFFGVTEEYLAENSITYDNLPPQWRDEFVSFARRYFDALVEDTPAKPDAAETIREIRRAGHRVIITTARTNEFYTDCIRTTKAELAKLGIEYDKLVCSFDKLDAYLGNDVDLVIDDSVRYCTLAEENGMKALLFNSLKNSPVETGLRRVSSWKEILSVVESGCDIPQRLP